MSQQPSGERHAEIHRQLAAALAELVPDDPHIPPHPYLRRHLAQHAAQGRVLDDAHVPPALLPWESSSALGRLLAVGDSHSARQQWLQAWAKLEPYSHNLSPMSRLTSLHLAHHAATSRHKPRTQPHSMPTPFAGSPVSPLWSDCASPDNVWAINEAAVTSLTTVAPGRRSQNRNMLVTGDDHGVVRVLRHDGSAAGPPIAVHEGAVEHLLPLYEGLVATGSTDGTVTILDAPRGRTIGQVHQRPGTWVSSLTLYKPEGRAAVLLAAFSDGYIAAFNTAAFQVVDIPLPRLERAAALLCGTTQSDGPGLLLYSQHDTVSCFDGRTALMHSRHPATIRALVALPTPGHYAVGDTNGNLVLHDVANTRHPRMAGADKAMNGPITALAMVTVDDQQTLASAGADGTVRLWQTHRLELIGESLQAHSAPINALTSLAGRSGARLITAGADRTVRNWPLTGNTFKHGRPAWNPITASALSSGPAHLLAITEGTRTLTWDIETGEKRPVIDHEPVTALAWVRVHHRMLVAAALSDNSIVLLDPTAERHPSTEVRLRGHYSPSLALVALPDPGRSSLLASGSADGTVRLWDLNTHEPVAVFTDHKFSVRCLASTRTASGALLASGGSDGNLRIWDTTSLTQHGATIRCDQNIVNDVAFAPSDDRTGRQLVTAGQNGTLKLWDLESVAKPVHEFSPRDGDLNAVTAFRIHDRRVVFAAAGSTSIHLWDATANRNLLQIVIGYPVNALRVAPHQPNSEPSTVLLATGEAGTMIFRIHHDRL